MKGTLEFNLPREQESFRNALQADKLELLIKDIKIYIHKLSKEERSKDKINMQALDAIHKIKWFIKDQEIENNILIEPTYINDLK